ncbi:glycosyltransferase [Burkholderia pseudomallei]|uniref:glycosyltransferase n=1 Tax=Burkholderia pseudomallei TaxID=28450 RepID=UPI0013680A2E|nr:glycosyltransferase [Burkholderia pseudomallei]MXN60964.1 glycosyltransferase [Burkholderia pseudomallei]
MLRHLTARGIGCRIITGHGNVGYGRGHNLAIAEARSRLHLVLNPDIDLEPHTFVTAREFFDAHPDAGLLAPRIADGAGGIQYLCRRYPTVLDLFARGFLPASMRRPLSKRLAHYEMRDVIGDASVVWEPPIVSGCFMLFRTGVLKRLGGFDPRYFLYFEDYDLSLRTHEFARVGYVPAMRVLHHGGGASRKGFAHIRMFAASAYRFFNRFGWRWW